MKLINLLRIFLIFIFICMVVYVVMNIEEAKSADSRYCAKKADVECNCWNFEKDLNFYVNSTDIIADSPSVKPLAPLN